ncbi:BAG-associated GRAM protein 1 [Dichanthelium oligosanthes]|uniref:BAG-associated GRAM protein 1 n=1 Tax=Dichanthelium oligosanthes TaxID=888268 RepID=A0A1E5WBE5_9POAL|nr:BAG-associated GRAM protein 1 [Dichanthelium oligosanthes]
MGQCLSWALGLLLPSLWEAEVAISATALLIAAFVLFLLTSDQQHAKQPAANGGGEPPASSSSHSSAATAACHRDAGLGRRSGARGRAVSEITCAPGACGYVIKLELLSAKYLIGANLDGSSDPFAVISCGEQKRFSSMVPSPRNPLWGEEFNFLVDQLPVEVTITIYDWDTVCKCKVIGSVTIAVLSEDETGASWYELDSKFGQICLRLRSTKAFPDSDSFFEEYTGVESPRKMILKKQRQVMIEGIGPLQTIYKLPHDEIVHQSYSCALERCFLHHGRMYISQWHLCFHSNVFSKQLTVIIPLQDIDEIKRSQHSLINPAITIFLNAGSGGHGTPRSCSQNGRVRYTFASFWSRNRTFRALETALQSYEATLEAEKQVRAHVLLQQERNSVLSSKTDSTKTPGKNIEKAITFQPFINEHVLADVTSKFFPGTPEKFFSTILGDNSLFFQQYRDARKDTDLKLSKWCASKEYGGKVREVTFRSQCHSPLCPPDTAVTEWQHAAFSKEKRNLIYETKHQAHDVPFGSYFEIHCRWSLRTTSSSTCQVNIKIGVNMKKWCILQSRIKSGATDEYRREVCKILEAACDYFLKSESNSHDSDEIVMASSP